MPAPHLRTGFQGRHLRLLPVAALVTSAVVSPPCLAAQTDLERIGQGDPRTGYESADYRTDSRSLGALTGIPADLAALAADPPLGLPELDDPPNQAAVDLGRRLFFDRRLSANQTISCGMCHVPEQAFTQNELATPVGIEGRFVRRNAPSLYNVGYRQVLFHDGRESTLVSQIWAPLLADNEMGNDSREAVLARLASDPEYAPRFAELFEEGLTEASLGWALAAYQTALLSADSPFDRWFYGGDSHAVSPEAKRGFILFNEVGCASCHQYGNAFAHFTDDALHRTGVEFASRIREATPPKEIQIAPGVIVPLDAAVPPPSRNDEGRAEVTGEAGDRWRYRTPTLRNVAITQPYMHDGSLATLEAVIDFYDAGSGGDPERDPRLEPLDLTDAQKSDLLAFLRSLTGSNVDALAADARTAPIGDPAGTPTGGPEPSEASGG